MLTVLVLNVMPALTGFLARNLGFTPADIGTFVSADVLGIALGTAISVRFMGLTSLRATLASGMAILLIANLASAAAGSVTAITALRFCGGIGSGLALGACFYVYGLAHRERNFAAYLIGQTALAFLVIVAIPFVAAQLGWRAVFVVLGLLTIPVLMLVSWLPTAKVAAPLGGSRATHARRSPLPAKLWLGLAGTVAFFLGQGSLYTFIERIGASSGFTEEVIAHSLSIFAMVGLLSCVFVLLLGSRVTSFGALLLGVAANVLGASAVFAAKPWLYTVAICFFYFSLPIIATCQFGAIARADTTGRAAVYASTATFGGFALGPYLGGMLVEQLGYVGVQWLDIIMIILTAVTLVPLLRRV
ncbi:MAG: MFS transporter [Betaproteobacteria bacterium]|nr:MAG: MFS transporter [Betaproteobacteria bacterium]